MRDFLIHGVLPMVLKLPVEYEYPVDSIQSRSDESYHGWGLGSSFEKGKYVPVPNHRDWISYFESVPLL